MEIILKCVKCGGLWFVITAEKPMMINIEDLDNLQHDFYTFTFVCLNCNIKIKFATGSD